MRLAALAASSFLLAVAAAGAAVPAGGLVIVTPPDRSVVDSRTISITVRETDTAIDELNIAVNRGKPLVRKKAADRTHFCSTGIQLAPGENTIRITGSKGGKERATSEIRIFYAGDFSGDPPPGFASYSFHGANDEPCRPCHRMNFTGIAQDPERPEQSPCFTCHKNITVSKKFVHGPSAVWSCTVCHAVRKDGSLPADDTSCTLCHDDSIGGWKAAKHRHGPTEAGKCTTCHNPHGSDQTFFLRLPPSSLCRSCHEEVASRPHVVSTRQGGHPTFIRPNPFHPSQDFTCTSCHNPHAGESPVFLNGFKPGSTIYDFCKTCHNF